MAGESHQRQIAVLVCGDVEIRIDCETGEALCDDKERALIESNAADLRVRLEEEEVEASLRYRKRHRARGL